MVRWTRLTSEPLSALVGTVPPQDTMEEISAHFSPRPRSDSVTSTGSQSTSSRMLLRQRLTMLMTCVGDLDPKDKVHAQVSKTLEEAFQVCGQKALQWKKDQFRSKSSLSVFRSVFSCEAPGSLLQVTAAERLPILVCGQLP